jgi:hypothetical protein
MMFGLFRRRKPIADPEALGVFIDENAAFLVQKGIYEYARARSGHYSKVLFKEPGFQTAVEVARWKAYPLGLAMVAEVADAVLRASLGSPVNSASPIIDLALDAFDRYPVPAALGDDAWRAERVALRRRLDFIGMHQPKRAFDICEPFARDYYDLMPIHEKLRKAEFPTLRNYLRVTLCNVHDELSSRLDVPAVAARLRQAAEA